MPLPSVNVRCETGSATAPADAAQTTRAGPWVDRGAGFETRLLAASVPSSSSRVPAPGTSRRTEASSGRTISEPAASCRDGVGTFETSESTSGSMAVAEAVWKPRSAQGLQSLPFRLPSNRTWTW